MNAAANIRIIISDVDGVWTDGRIIYSGENRETKEFNVRDGLGVRLAQRAGIAVAVITSRKSRALERRCRELGITELVQDARSKLEEMKKLLNRLGLTAEQACYIGDDLPDLAPIRASAFSAAPADAAPEVLAAVTIKLGRPGGGGAFRELVETLLQQRGEWESIVEELERGTPKIKTT